MRSLLTIILQILAVMALVFLVATLGGVMIWFLWPMVVPSLFPGLVASGAVAGKVNLVTAILAHWMVGTMFSSLASVKSSKSGR